MTDEVGLEYQLTEIVSQLLSGRSVCTTASTAQSLLARHPLVAPLIFADAGGVKVLPPSLRGNALSDGERGTVLGGWSAADDLHLTFDSVLARCDVNLTTRSAMASVLRQCDERRTGGAREEALERADNLDRSVEHWLRQRLWSINRAPELVAHDDRHVAAVEQLAAALVEPFWVHRVGPIDFLPIELEWLGVAAWLHDWGHVGGAVVPWVHGGVDGIVATSRDVRILHGLISQHLMGPLWRGMHGLDPVIAGPAAVLCGHHQSWTSFGTDQPGRRDKGDPRPDPLELLADLRVKPVTLERDFEKLTGLPKYVDLDRFRVLVAILRVADGVDVGRHRVPDIGRGRAGFLARCLHQEAMRTASVLQFMADRQPHAKDGIEIARTVALEALQGGRGEPLDHVSPIADVDIPEITELRKYRDFVLEQGDHFDKHQLVDGVRFEHTGRQFDVVITPSESTPKAVTKAVNAVASDLQRELRKSGVGKVLGWSGISFGQARTPRSFAPPVAIDIETTVPG